MRQSHRLLSRYFLLLPVLALAVGLLSVVSAQAAPGNGQAIDWGDNVYGQLGMEMPVAVDNSGVLTGQTVTDVSAGPEHTCAVAGGAAYCWGLNSSGQLGNNSTEMSPVPVPVNTSDALAGRTVTSISAGGDFTCAIADGDAFCWGNGTDGRLGNGDTAPSSVPVAVDTTAVPEGRTINTISAGAAQACAVDSEGAAYCWGDNTWGQLGDNTQTDRSSATAVYTDGVLSGQTVTRVSAGTEFTCAVASGASYCWGKQSNGRLGNNSVLSSFKKAPVAVYTQDLPDGLTFTEISAGTAHACAVAGAQAFCWGRNTSGQLGNGTTTQTGKPVAVNTGGPLAGTTVTGISAGDTFSCAVASAAAYCWGNNGSGQLGTNSFTNSSVPVAVDDSGVLAGATVTGISSGTSHACMVADGAAYCQGANGNALDPMSGQLGMSVPVAVDTSGVLDGLDVSSVSAGGYHSCAVAEGAAYCWGFNDNGELGNNSTTSSPVPVAVDTSGALADSTLTSVSAGAYYSCAVADGAAYCWGNNDSGRLGDGTANNSLVPVAVDTSGVLADKTVTSISAGYEHACVIADGEAFCWGANWNGQLGDPGAVDFSREPVAVDTSGVLGDKSITSISAGYSHTCAVADGDAYCWGDNADGKLGDNSTDQSPVPVAVDTSGALSGLTVSSVTAGGSSCAVADGAAYCWGPNGNGQLGNNSTDPSLVPVAVDTSGALDGSTVTEIEGGNQHTCAIASGGAYCWGLNGKGQLGDNTIESSDVAVEVDTSNLLAPGETVVNISAGGEHSAAVGAVESTVTFDKNGGAGTMGAQSSHVPEPLDANTFTRTGYTFTAWNTAANGSGDSYENEEVYPFTADANLYAQWSQNTYTVTYDGNGNDAGGAPAPEDADYDTTIILPGNSGDLEKTGYSFTGWNTQADGNGDYYSPGANFTIPSEDITLYAQWTKGIRTTVEFTTTGPHTWTVPSGVTSVEVVANGGGGGAGQFKRPNGGSGASVTATLATTPGAVLDLVVGGGGSRGESTNGGGGGGGATTVNSGTDDQVIAGGGGGAGTRTSATGGAAGANPGGAGSAGGPSGTGGQGGSNGVGGAGSSAGQDGDGGAGGNGGGSTNGGTGTGDGTGGNATFSTYGGGGGGGGYGGGGAGAGNTSGGFGGGSGGSTGPGTPVYATAGNGGVYSTNSGAGGNGSITITYFAPASVTFNANGGSGDMSPQVSLDPAPLEPNTFTREGYAFASWNTQADGNGDTYANEATYPFLVEATLYAQWSPNTYTVTYDGNNNTSGDTPAAQNGP